MTTVSEIKRDRNRSLILLDDLTIYLSDETVVGVCLDRRFEYQSTLHIIVRIETRKI